MGYLPVFVDLTDRTCLVVGGGTVAAGKVKVLLEAGARVVVVAPRIGADVAELASARGASLEILRREYRPEDLPEGTALVFAATDDPDVQEAVRRDAGVRGVWMNAVDEPARCGFIMPAVLRRGRIAVAIGTGGSSPALARHLRDRLENWIGPEFEAAGDHLADLRGRLRPGPRRQRVLSRLVESGLVEAFREGDRHRVTELTESALAELDAPGDARPDGEA